MAKKPFLLAPAGLLGWSSYYQIMPQLIEVWRQIPANIIPIWYPRPKLEKHLINDFKTSASALVFPLGIGHYDSLRTLRMLRKEWGLHLPAVIMVASDITKGANYLFDHRDVLLECDQFVVNCEPEKNLVKMALGKTANVHVIPLPVDMTVFKPRSLQARLQFKSKIGLSSKDPLIGYAGRISYQKNIHELLKVFFHVRARHPKAKLAIAGLDDDIGTPHLPKIKRPRYMHFLNSLITELNLRDAVIFSGPLEQKPLAELLGSCDAQVSLTLHSGEDFGYSIAQGMSCGAPTVVSHWGGGIGFINGGAEGVLVNVIHDGPRINTTHAICVLLKTLDKPQNAAARCNSLKYSQKFLSSSNCLGRWRSLMAHLIYDPKELIIPQTLFSSHFKGFSSPRDPLYQRICRIYSGEKDLVGVKNRKIIANQSMDIL